MRESRVWARVDVPDGTHDDITPAYAPMGAHTAFRCFLRNGLLVKQPANLVFEQVAALIFGGTTALEDFRCANPEACVRVLVNGASGSVGTEPQAHGRAVPAERGRGTLVLAPSVPSTAVVPVVGAAHVQWRSGTTPPVAAGDRRAVHRLLPGGARLVTSTSLADGRHSSAATVQGGPFLSRVTIPGPGLEVVPRSPDGSKYIGRHRLGTCRWTAPAD